MKKMIQNATKFLKAKKSAYYGEELNRKLAGIDKNGNRYYQYYDEDGDESKRGVETQAQDGLGIQEYDAYWDQWLRGQINHKYNENQMKQFYHDQYDRIDLAMDYEIKDADMMKQFRASQKEKAMASKSSLEKGANEKYEPGYWNPGSKRK